jgi:hypothetical protein
MVERDHRPTRSCTWFGAASPATTARWSSTTVTNKSGGSGQYRDIAVAVVFGRSGGEADMKLVDERNQIGGHDPERSPHMRF